jgi:ubiquinone/menaquinone biosynthesis C-methylase UbiE
MKKLAALFCICVINIFLANISFAQNIKKINSENAKRVLINKLKGGDYANAGDTQGIDFVLSKLPDSSVFKNANILDFGSGYGGSANYLHSKGFKKIWGVDKNSSAVSYATLKYPHLKFFHADAKNITKKFRKNFFSFIYAFNTLYPIEDKKSVIDSFTKLSKKGAILAIFDYSKTDIILPPKQKSLKGLGGHPIYPVNVKEIEDILSKSGWKIRESIDISDKYIEWYDGVSKIFASQRAEMIKKHKEKDIEEIENLFNKILFSLRNNHIGGHLLIAEKML